MMRRPRRLRSIGALILFSLVSTCLPAGAVDTVFTSTAVLKEEVSRLGGEEVAYLKAPVTDYLPATVATLGAFALTYTFDRDIRSKLAGVRNKGLDNATDAGSTLGHPLLHLGVAAALYGVGAVADKPAYLRVGEELGEALIITDATAYVLKTAIGRGRPSVGADRGDFRPFQLKRDYDSLPSLHTASSFATAHVLASETESVPAKVLCYTAATFVGFSRLYQDEHWASDLVLGAALGELAGRVVTSYRGKDKPRVSIVPVVSPQGGMVALQGRF